MTKSPSSQFWWPQNWPLGFGLVLMWLLGQLPLNWIRWLGRGLGRLLYTLAGRRRKIAQRNLELCFPALTLRQRENLTRQCFKNLGMGLLETCTAWFAPGSRMGTLELEGLEPLKQSLRAGHGVILLNYHYTGIELGGSLLAQQVAGIHALYREHKQPLFEKYQYQGRSRFATPIAEHKIRALLAALKRGELLWYLPDQDHGPAQSVFTAFFGIDVATITAAVWLAQKSAAAVHPMEIHRTRTGFRITLHPPLTNFPSGDIHADAARQMTFIESVLRREPSDYLWVHRRFKTRPPGEPSLY